jgi:MFS family permease
MRLEYGGEFASGYSAQSVSVKLTCSSIEEVRHPNESAAMIGAMDASNSSRLGPASDGRLNSSAATCLLASMLMAFLAASSAPSPLYALYRETFGFSALTLTVIFASYAFALLAALLTFGALSDYRGRREVILIALILEMASTFVFWDASSVGWLFAARVLQGAATGIATTALSAALIDLDKVRGPLLTGVSPMVGMAVGALGGSALVQFAGRPTERVFEVLLGVFALQTVAALFLPETSPRKPGVWRSLRPSIGVPVSARATMWQVMPVNAAQWALGGFYLSLGPTLARVVTGNNSPLTGGAFIAALVLSAAVAILFVRSREARWTLLAGTVALALGLLLTLVGIAAHSAALLFIGTVVAGVGFGAAFNGSLRSLVASVSAEERGVLMSTFYVFSYLAFSLPPIAAGLCAGYFGLQGTALGLGASLLALTLIALGLIGGQSSDQSSGR